MRPIGVVAALVALLCCSACDTNARPEAKDASGSAAADTGGSGSDTGGSPGQDAGGQAGQDAGASPGQDVGSAPGRDAGGTNPGNDAGGSPLPGRLFPPGAVWNQDVYDAPLDPKSAAVIADLAAHGGWGNGNIMQIDFSFEVLFDDGAAPMRTFERTDDFYEPDCDFEQVPVPAGGALEGEDGYECTTDGDCHLIVAQTSTGRLYEMWRANIVGGTFYGGCLAIWDMNRIYPDDGRGEGCTSADAAGFPIAPLLFTADEVAAGAIHHAIRFILPNNRIQHHVYVHPATHSTGPTSGGPDAPPYGVHLRLRRDFPLASLPNDGARTVAVALQRYGMFLADGGNIALTARSDRTTTARWDGLLAPRDLQLLKVTDFEMVDHGSWLTWSGDCYRNP